MLANIYNYNEEIVISPTGESLTQLSIKKPLYDKDGIIIGIIGNTIDITERKKIEIQLIKAIKKAESANKAKTVFLQNMRHDFRTPFSGILGMAGILYANEEDHDKREQLQGIIISAQALLEQLNEITDFIAVEDGGLMVLEKQFHLHKVVEDLKNMLSPAAREKELKFTVEIDKKVPQYIIGDRLRTQRILMNLLTNAVKFTNTGQVLLRVCVGKEEGNNNSIIIKFNVKDTGVGMPKEEQNIIFEKFSKLTPSHRGIYPGKGLGLKIVKQFLDELGGEIHVESKRNEGSTFIALIPYKLPLLKCDEKELLVDSGEYVAVN